MEELEQSLDLALLEGVVLGSALKGTSRQAVLDAGIAAQSSAEHALISGGCLGS
jgi:hypothetical protein